MNFIVIRYSELALKGKNRNWFEDTLMRNIRKHLSVIGKPTVKKVYGRLIAEMGGPLPAMISILKYIPGIANFSVAVSASHDMNEIAQKALELFTEQTNHKILPGNSFRVSTSRSSKDTPLNSQQISAQIGGVILEKFPELKVNLTAPDFELGIEIWAKKRSILYMEKIQGSGGLPSGTSGNVLSFISGGIDSPVASWFMMKRGCTVTFIHFHSYPFIGEQSRQKVIDLVVHLSRFQPATTLIIVPFAEAQKAIRESCAEKNRTILYRRSMYRIAEALKDRFKIQAYATGEAVGQVASQTLENLACTEAVTTLPVLRPLIGMDKSEITERAKQIGTFPISIQPYADCCTVFQPQKPEIHGVVSEIAQDESNLDLNALLVNTLDNLEILHFETKVESKFWE